MNPKVFWKDQRDPFHSLCNIFGVGRRNLDAQAQKPPKPPSLFYPETSKTQKIDELKSLPSVNSVKCR